MEMKKLQESDEYCESLSNKGDNQTKMRDTDINASILEQTGMKKLLDEPRLEEGTSVAIEVYPAEKKPSAEHAVTSKLADMQESECDNFPTEQPKQRSKNDTASAVDKKKGVEIMSEQDGSPKRQKHDSGKTRSAELENEITVLSTGHEVQAAAHSSDAKGGAM